jgi:hypothetical protein
VSASSPPPPPRRHRRPSSDKRAAITVSDKNAGNVIGCAFQSEKHAAEAGSRNGTSIAPRVWMSFLENHFQIEAK